MQVCFLLVWTMAIHYLQHIHDGEVGDLLPCFCFCFCFCFYPVSPAYTRWWSGGPPTQPVEGTSSSSHSTGSQTRWWVKFQFSSTFAIFRSTTGWATTPPTWMSAPTLGSSSAPPSRFLSTQIQQKSQLGIFTFTFRRANFFFRFRLISLAGGWWTSGGGGGFSLRRWW